jgi:BlaI family transcriptional regulator, penicillinase repressor
MPRNSHQTLSRRERQIMDVIYTRGRATANEVIRELPDERHSSTVRTQLRVLEEKGHLRHEEEGLRYVYSPVTPRSAARQTALRHLIETFFEGSAEKLMSTLLGSRTRLSEDELDHLAEMIAEARRAKKQGG